jgi:hypothetical protein
MGRVLSRKAAYQIATKKLNPNPGNLKAGHSCISTLARSNWYALNGATTRLGQNVSLAATYQIRTKWLETMGFRVKYGKRKG